MITQTGRIRALRGFSKFKHLWKPFSSGTKWWKWKFPVLFQHLNSISKPPGAQEGISLGLRCCFLPLPSQSVFFFMFFIFSFRKTLWASVPEMVRVLLSVHLTKSTASYWLNDGKLCWPCFSWHKWQTELTHPLFLLLYIQFFSAHPNWISHWKDHSLECLNNHVSSLSFLLKSSSASSAYWQHCCRQPPAALLPVSATQMDWWTVGAGVSRLCRPFTSCLRGVAPSC